MIKSENQYGVNKHIAAGSGNKEIVLQFPIACAEIPESSNKGPIESTMGGSGLCNAIAMADALQYSHGKNTVTFMGAVGMKPDGKPDEVAREMSDWLEQRNVVPFLQTQPGQTEFTAIVVGAGESRGILKNGQPEDKLAREKFEVNDKVIARLAESDWVTASAFKPEVIMQLAREFKIRKENGIFVWTLNSESAKSISQNPFVQRCLEEGLVDGLFLNRSEGEKLNMKDQNVVNALAGVPLVVQTIDKDGCLMTHNTGQTSTTYHVDSLQPIKYTANTNGAGEAHHNNTQAALIAAINRGVISTNLRQASPSVLKIAGLYGNQAGAIKVAQGDSTWFPTFDYLHAGEQIENVAKGANTICVPSVNGGFIEVPVK